MNDGATKKHRSKALDALHRYCAAGPDLSDGAEFAKMLEGESDRGLVILLVTFLEDALLERILRALPRGAEERKSLTKGGPLRNFEQRVAMGRALGILTAGDAQMLDTFREMRNACAHSRREISFRTPALRDTFKLALDEGSVAAMDEVPPMAVRTGFAMCAGFMLVRLQGHSLAETHGIISEAIGKESGFSPEFAAKIAPRAANQRAKGNSPRK